MVITIWVLSNGYYYIYISITGKNLRHQKPSSMEIKASTSGISPETMGISSIKHRG